MKHLILFAALMCLALRGFSQNNPTPATQEGRRPTVQELIVADIKGLGGRSDLIKYISSADSDFVFKRRNDVGGKPDYYASDRYLTSVEMVGNDDEITLIKWIMTFIPNNGRATNEEINRMAYFAMLMGAKDGVDWFLNIYKNFSGNFKEEYIETKEFTRMGRIAVFKYSPQLRNMTLTITVKDGKK